MISVRRHLKNDDDDDEEDEAEHEMKEEDDDDDDDHDDNDGCELTDCFQTPLENLKTRMQT